MSESKFIELQFADIGSLQFSNSTGFGSLLIRKNLKHNQKKPPRALAKVFLKISECQKNQLPFASARIIIDIIMADEVVWLAAEEEKCVMKKIFL